MIVIIAGGRNYQITPRDFAILDRLRQKLPITTVVSGLARGADMGGKKWAESRGIPVIPYPYAQEFEHFGGFIRNSQMADVAHAGIIFPGDRGTADMREKLERRNKPVIDPHKEGLFV